MTARVSTERILHLLDHSIPLQSGYTFRTRSILRRQQEMGWGVTALTTAKQGPSDAAFEDVDGLQFYRTSPTPSRWARLPVLDQWKIVRDASKRLDSILPHVSPGLVHAHSPALNGLAALSVARRRRLPFVYEVRAFWEDAAVDHGTAREWGLRYRLTRAMETHVLRQADAVTTICEGLRRDMVDRGVPQEKITVIPNAVDMSAFSPITGRDPSLENSLGLRGRRVIGFIGSFYRYEGLDLLVDAAARFRDEASDVVVLLVGGGPEETRLRQRVAKEGLEERVRFAGRVPHAEVAGYYSLLDALVYPRMSMRLTELVTPLKPLEAMAQNLLVVASDVGGHKELIRDRETGFLFPAGDAEALATTVLSALATPDRAAAIKFAARRFVESERTWEHSVARYAAVYQYASREAERRWRTR